MKAHISIRNWDKFQHYSSRNPPWIKMHRSILDDYGYGTLDDNNKLLLLMLWLIASTCDNKIPADLDWIKRRANIICSCSLQSLIDENFIEYHGDRDVASKPLASCKQNSILETETETETETEQKQKEKEKKEKAKTKIEPDPPLEKPDSPPQPKSKPNAAKKPAASVPKKKWLSPDWINPSAWSDFEQHRKDIRKPLSNMARTKAANQLKGLTHEQQQSCIDTTIQARWTGLFPRGNNGNHKSTSASENQFHHDLYRKIAAEAAAEEMDGGAVRAPAPEVWDSVDTPIRRVGRGH